MKLSRVFVALLPALLLCACSVGPDYIMPSLVVPERFSSAGHIQSVRKPRLAHWWTRLGDPTLNVLIDEAVQGNSDVAMAKARVQEARATYRQSVGTLFPTLRNADSVTRQRSLAQDASDADTGPEITSQFQVGFDASWEIDLFGKNQRGVEAAGYGLQAAEEQFRLALLSLVGDVAFNYVQARGYQARIALAKRTAAAQRETARLTKTRFDAGGASGVDAAISAGQASMTEAVIPSLEVSYSESVHRLGVLIGRAPGELTDRMKRGGPIPKPEFPMPVGIPADTLFSRPDVLQAERQLAQATAKIGQAQAARYPAVSLTGNIATTGLKVGDLGKSSSIGWSFGPTVSVPIFNGGQLRAAVEIEQARRDQYFVTYQASVMKALEDVENALVATTQEHIRYRKLIASVEAYRQANSLSHFLYQGGSADFLTVLDAERSLYSAEEALVQSRITMVTSYIALNKALGGGWGGGTDVAYR